MEVLITGAAGFLGANLVQHLLESTNWNLVLLDRLDSTVTLDRLTYIPGWDNYRSRTKFVWWDLKAELNSSVKHQIGEVDYIVHLAASSHVDRSILDPLAFVMDNVVGTCNLLNWARGLKSLEKLYYQSTDEVMGPAMGYPYTELDAPNPTNPYSASKLGGEALVVAYANTYQIPAVLGRCMNVYGPMQYSEKYIPLCIRKILKNETVQIHADSTRTISGSRSYISTNNLCSAIVFLLTSNTELINKQSRLAGIYNISGEQEISNLHLAILISGILDRSLKYQLVDLPSTRPNHDLTYQLSGSKLSTLGWSLAGDFSTNLERTVKWYLKHPEWIHITD